MRGATHQATMQTIKNYLYRYGRGMAKLYVVATALFALSATPVFAFSPVDVVYDTDGDIDFSSFPTSGCADGIFAGARFYFGLFPDTSDPQETLGFGGAIDNCQTLFAGFSGNLESWQNEGDGDYFMLFGINGDEPPTAGNYIFYATRSAGSWVPAEISATSTRIITQISPQNGSLEPDETVTFSFSYYNNSSEEPMYTSVGYEIQNMTNPAQSSYSEDIIASGGITFSHDQTLSSGSFRLWRPFLYASSTSSFIYGDWYSFDVGYRSASSTPYLNPETASSTNTYLQTFCTGFGSSTDAIYTAQGFKYSSCYVLGFLFVPSNESVNQFTAIPFSLQNKFPFAYFYQVKDLFNNGSSTANLFGTMQVNLPLVGTTTILSAGTINYFIGPTTASVLKQLSTFALWLMFAYTVYKRALKLFKGKH